MKKDTKNTSQKVIKKSQKEVKKEKCCHDDFWTVYKMINFSHSFDTQQTCEACGKKISVKLRGYKKSQNTPMMHILSAVFWMAPVFFILAVASYYMESFPLNYIIAILMLIVYHFAAMYYIIKGPFLKVKIK